MIGYGDEAIKPSTIAAASVVPVVHGLDKTVTLIIVTVIAFAVLYRIIGRTLRWWENRKPALEAHALDPETFDTSTTSNGTEEDTENASGMTTTNNPTIDLKVR